MDMQDLLSRLNWFYSLETNQVDLYYAQSKTFKGRYSGLVFERLASIEQGHVDNISEKIRQLGGKPSYIGDVLSSAIGKLAGELLSLTGLEDTLTANILLEQKAMKDYNKLIDDLQKQQTQDQELIKLLQYNFVDEHIHTEWFRTKLLALKQYEYSVKHFTLYTTTGENKHAEPTLEENISQHKKLKVLKPQRLKIPKKLKH